MGGQAATGAHRVAIAPERLARWLAGFAERHGEPVADGLVLTAPDGAVAVLEPPPGVPTVADVDSLVAAALAERSIGLLLVRRGGVAVGVAVGARLVVSKVDSSYVQSRTAAGGWSQQRFARRRENQARALAASAAGITARLLTGAALDALVTGGDRRLVADVLADPRLAGLPLPARHLEVPDPRLAVLRGAVGAARAVHVLVS